MTPLVLTETAIAVRASYVNLKVVMWPGFNLDSPSPGVIGPTFEIVLPD
ncbi:hypothetical protein [Nodosilinea sp. P-1105]|nr:hypothetical protein [Nodosilinea sp. P-1105]